MLEDSFDFKKIPAEEDWHRTEFLDPVDELDYEWIRDLYFGADKEKAYYIYERVPQCTVDDMKHFMPVPFRYYLICWRDFILEELYEDDYGSFLSPILSELSKINLRRLRNIFFL